MFSIEAVIFSYKSKNLKQVVDSLVKNTGNSLRINVYDQHNLDRKKIFNDHIENGSVVYTHVFWDEIVSPNEYKSNSIFNSQADFFLIISDDTIVSKNWDKELISFIEKNNCVVSGTGKLSLKQDNLFYLQKEYVDANAFSFTGFVDRNFIFGKTDFFRNIYPADVKYNGEEEMLSLNLFYKNIQIFSAPTGTYDDLNQRTLERKYVPFSLNHNYNLIIQRYKDAPIEFLNKLGISKDLLNKLPFATNDVLYDPYSLKYQDLDGQKFILDVKGIF